jgi:hypothetical protein
MSRYRNGTQLLGDMVARATRPALKKRGFAEERLLLEWNKIVGDEFAHRTAPQKLAHDRHGKQAAVLHIICEPAWAIELQYFEPVILEKIASYFGYRAVERLHITQHPLPKSAKPAQIKDTSQIALDAATKQQLGHIQDPELRHALQRLAQSRQSESDSGNT